MAGKLTTIIAAAALCATLGACSTAGTTATGSSNQTDATTGETSSDTSSSNGTVIQIKTSTDKHITYVKNYVGMNCANVGYTGMDGLRHDDYGNGRYVQLVFVTPDGTHLSLDDESEDLRQYKVSAQNVEPNTEINCTFQTNSDGEEYDNLVEFQNIEEIVLAVDEVGQDGNTNDMTVITPSPDHNSCYVRDYRERNLADCGYNSLSNNLTDDYGSGCYIKLDIVTDDGSYADTSDVDSLAQYKVTDQSVEPNTQITLVHTTNSSGEEYSNLLDEQSIEYITLYVTSISS